MPRQQPGLPPQIPHPPDTRRRTHTTDPRRLGMELAVQGARDEPTVNFRQADEAYDELSGEPGS